jgi:osmoprotectant transport system ATP-binding protein
LHDKLGLTTIMITHDMTEAMLLADRIAVMHLGALIATGTAGELATSSEPYVRQLMSTPRRQTAKLNALMADAGVRK